MVRCVETRQETITQTSGGSGVTHNWTAEQVRELRRHMRLTQAEFADLCKVGRVTVTLWETGTRPSLKSMQALDQINLEVVKGESGVN